MQIPIIFEDKDFLVVDKPQGLLVHTDGRSVDKTLVDWILENRPEIIGVGESLKLFQGKKQIEIKRPGIVHRLDRETSGVLIIAKNSDSFLFLKNKFKNREIQKNYRAFVYGNFSEDKLEGIINKPIARSASDFRKWSAEFGSKGEKREAITYYKVLKQNKDFAYLNISPKTGRTHQIRVHMKSISHPVIGDKLYAPKRDFVLGLKRLALHSFSLEFELSDGRVVKFESKLPKEFKEAEALL